MAKALQGLNKVNKMYKWLKCHEENWGVEEDACRKVKEFKKWIERFWTAPAQEWVEEKEGMRDECVDLGALFGCKPKVKGSE